MFLRLPMPLQAANLAFWISKCDRIHFLDEVLHEAGLRIQRSRPCKGVQSSQQIRRQRIVTYNLVHTQNKP
ncbi:hypothetical protein Y032_0165g42 [Ancylostoma ceylanicum]|uniref:Uncharacterized protein n=1 Tax=Ancylostoma ceylanicum TaxID=53326 RepID=A0A016SX36_9BILA|nr:hypothetical protein Y032_0165g42 [Ancylostoma ceylanicum]